MFVYFLALGKIMCYYFVMPCWCYKSKHSCRLQARCRCIQLSV